MSQNTRICDACGTSVTWAGSRGFNLAHPVCVKKGMDATSPDHPGCPVHGGLIWAIGPYSAFRACPNRSCTAGKKGKSYRFCAPRGAHAPQQPTPYAWYARELARAIETDNQAPHTPQPEETPAVTAVTAAVKPNGDAVQNALAALMSAMQPKVELDEAAITRLVETKLEAKLASHTRTLVITHPDKPGYEAKVDHPHPYLARVIKLLNAGIPVYLWGPAGGGKTTAGMQAATALLRDSEIDTLDPSTFRSMVQGYMSPDGKPVHTSFTRCWVEGKLYIADECDNAPGHVQTLFNSALANGHAPLAWGNAERGKGFAFLGTGNTPGRPTRAFPDRKPMSAAFADRMYFVHWPLDEQAERAWSGVNGKAKRNLTTPEPREITTKAWVDFVQGLREWSVDNAPTLMITPRASIVGLQALACGETPEQVADALIFRGADDELRRKALAAVRIP